MVNTSADNADTMLDNQPTVLLEQCQDIREHTRRPQPLSPAPRRGTPEPRPRPRTPETHTLSRLEFLVLVTPQKPRPVGPTLREADAAGNTSDVDVEQQRIGESAYFDCLPDVPLPDVPLPDIPLPDVPLSDVPLADVTLPDVPFHEARPDCWVGVE
jgi:hypothetical protein